MNFLARFRHASRRDLITSAIITAIVVTGLGILASYIYVHTVDQQHSRDYERAKQLQLRNTSAYIYNKFVAYRQVLLAGSTAINIKGADAITRSDWKLYYDSNLLSGNFPGILGLGYAKYIPADQLQAVTDTIRADGYPTFSVYPDTERSEYTSIIFIEPFNQLNQRAFGYDMFSEPIRHVAMSKARDSANFAMTAPVELRQDTTSSATKNGLLYYPVYEGGIAPPSPDERRAKVKGYVYIAFHVQQMMQTREKELADLGITYTISDVTNGNDLPIYSFTKGEAEQGDSANGELLLGGRTWRISMHIPRSAVDANTKPFLLFIGGVAASSLLGMLVYLLLRSRIGKIYSRHEDELQNTKDELLALASHQLRTPASGVRQYLGMLTQGYFGALTAEQLEVADKAYRANDRQLEIIDQLLYVAKADAGQLILQPEACDIAALTQGVLDDMSTPIALKKITIKASLAKSAPFVGDERLLRMIIENLISNAVKYSYEKSTVQIKLSDTKTHVKLEVADRGVGIAPADQEFLFKKFSRIQNPLSVKEGGSGLGLYLAQRLAEAHGGTITVHTAEGTGSRFVLTLPKGFPMHDTVIQLTE